MIILGLSLLFMFAVSVAALVTPTKIQESALASSWAVLSDDQKSAIQISLNCCGFNDVTQNNSNSNIQDHHPSCHVEPLTDPNVSLGLKCMGGGFYLHFLQKLTNLMLTNLYSHIIDHLHRMGNIMARFYIFYW